MWRSKHYGLMMALALLMGYVWLGRTKVPFHGDEADHLFKSHDFVTYFVERRPQDLKVTPPVAIDSPEHIRLLTGTTTAYLTGYLLWSNGVKKWPGPWYYGLDAQWNIENGRWPVQAVLYRGRMATTILAMLSIPLAFGLAWQLSKSDMAALATAFLVATQPAWLLSSRRVMQEAALGTLSLLVILLAIYCGRRTSWRRWLALALVSGLCLAAKPTGAIAVASAFLALGLLKIHAWRQLAMLAVTGMLAIGTHLVLTPAIWGGPLSRTKLAVELRAQVLQGQTRASPAAYGSKIERWAALVRQPFLSELQYYETPAFAGVIDEQIADYETAHWQGWQMKQEVAWFWTGCAGIGFIALAKGLQPALSFARDNSIYSLSAAQFVAVVWIVCTGLALGISVPLAWQRYYLLWALAMCILAGLGFRVAMEYSRSFLRRIWQQWQTG